MTKSPESRRQFLRNGSAVAGGLGLLSALNSTSAFAAC